STGDDLGSTVVTVEPDLGDDDAVGALHAVDTRRMARRRSQSTKRALVLGTVAVLFGIALVVGISYAAGTDRVELSNLGDEDFKAGRAENLADRIREDQRPRL